MKNRLALSTQKSIKSFQQELSIQLSGNLSEKLINNLSNILALDYANRLKSAPSLKKYLLLCIDRLQNYLGHKVITNEDFATSMTLFCVAITPKKNTNEPLNPEQVHEAVVEAVIDMHFKDLSPEEKEVLKFVLMDLLNRKDGYEISNFLNSNPKLFHCIVVTAIREKIKQEEIVEFVKLHLNRLIIESKTVDKKINKLKNLGSKFSLAAALMSIASAGLTLGGLVLPAFMLPATALSVKYAPKAGEKAGAIVAGNIESIQSQKETLAEIKGAVIDLSGKSNSVIGILAQEQGVTLENIREKLQQQRINISYDSLKKNSPALNIKTEAGQEQRVSTGRIR